MKEAAGQIGTVQEGEQPPEAPTELLLELDLTFDRLQSLVQEIDRANARTAFDGKRTIAGAIAEHDVVGRKRDALTALAEAASTRQDRYSKSEVKFVASVPVAELQRQADGLAKRYRELDTKLQELNRSTDVGA